MVEKLIHLAPYSKKWPREFEREKKRLQKALGKWAIAIEHVGSTAIPGMAAKPIIDIMLGVHTLLEADLHCVSKIQQLGYEYFPLLEKETPGRRFFQNVDSQGLRTHHIHLVEINSPWWKRHLLFRDYLRTHPAVAQEYEGLKRSLAQKFSDTNEYATAKTAFIREIEARAEIDRP
jgi:GrpB-like predicted nucleotidyltransferase (UPF0157 family)